LIHPYASSRPMTNMLPKREATLRHWAKELHQPGYLVGTAIETIDYSAGGTTLDWMFSLGSQSREIIPFVHEAAVPEVCDDRWCGGITKDNKIGVKVVMSQLQSDTLIGDKFVTLALRERLRQNSSLPPYSDNTQTDVLLVLQCMCLFALSFVIFAFLKRGKSCRRNRRGRIVV
jgi:hypothetical protein